MTPRQLLYQAARAELRQVRPCYESLKKGRTHWADYLGTGEPDGDHNDIGLAGLQSLGRANALRAFAQRKLPKCEECSGSGAGWGTPPSMRHLNSPSFRISSMCVERGCEACLGSGVRLGEL